MKYRKKSIIVEAEQWFPDKPVDGVVFPSTIKGCGWIETLEGGHVVSPGDWIVTGIKGEKYPVKPHIFDITYEQVSE
jgi:hypothetical protein